MSLCGKIGKKIINKMVHTIGDSHAGGVTNLTGAFDKISGINRHWLGPRLMYSISREGINLNSMGINSGDTVILCFGEIDCRFHVHKFISQNTYQQVIDNLVESYFNLIKNLIDNYNVRVIVYNVVPSIKKGTVEENQSYPFLGTDEERKSYVTYMNYKLSESCKVNNILFIDVYNKYICEDGFLKREFSDGNVHITEHSFIEDFLKKNNIL
jgi:hypothetical protein